jgi:hypothetical protein
MALKVKDKRESSGMKAMNDKREREREKRRAMMATYHVKDAVFPILFL